ncbi:phage major capsid protein [Clostridium tertium]|uniref:phage major capsid protein n=1 Tax=Clostridium tertium TaxID=1559 RepID=UPI0024B36345|nr:phage major capsid protein [Clostridium tertium]MDI9216003.1 phage major capsid protein [Clostridium tertium]
MNKIMELERDLESLKNNAESLKNEGKLDEALKVVDSIKDKKEEIKKAKAIEEELLENEGMENMENKVLENKKEEVSFIHAYAKSVMGKPLTDAEDRVLKNAISGEENVQIKELSTTVKELLREHRGLLKQFVTVHKTPAISGQFPILKTTEKYLVDVVDGVDMSNDDDGLGFELITFSLKKKGRLFALTDSILKFTSADLIAYVAKLFVECYIMTVNKAILDKLMLQVDGRTKKEYKVVVGVEDVVDSTMLDLDTALIEGSALYMNRQTLAKLAKDKNVENGLRYIQTDLTQPAKPFINGVEIRVVAKELEPYKDTTKMVYPILFANMAEAVIMFENEEYTTDMQRNFRANVVDQKIITYFDVQEADKEAYIILALEEATE